MLTTTKINKDLVKRLKILAVHKEVTLQQLIDSIIVSAIEKLEKQLKKRGKKE